MIHETIATGRDVNSAIDSGCQDLGVSRDDAQFEIISLPRKGFLGLKTYPAKVRVYVELPDPKPTPRPAVPQPPRPAPVAQPPRPAVPQTPRPAPVAQPPRPAAAAPTPAPAQPQRRPEAAVAGGSGAAPAPAHPPRPERGPRPAPAPRREAPAPGPTAPAAPAAPAVEIEPTDAARVRVEKSAIYVENILRTMGFGDVKVTPKYFEDCVCLQLAGTGLGVIIGRRGETLDSLQYLASLVANRGEGDYIRVNIDSGNYREKREKTLEALARKLALTAAKTGKSTTLEPMNPYERRVIHGAVSQIRGATSSSVGVDPNRRVVISAAGPRKTPRPAAAPAIPAEGSPVAENAAPGTAPVAAPRGDRPPRPFNDRGPSRGGRPPHREERRPLRPGNAPGSIIAPKAPRPKLDDGPAPERVLAPKAVEAPVPIPKAVELTPEEKAAVSKAPLYGKIEF